ncbi:MAG: hypothetical protein VXZ82_11450 [Planctomycetota bacterium]|nr:hypothetical protein [Planctomycetota bacterium]
MANETLRKVHFQVHPALPSEQQATTHCFESGFEEIVQQLEKLPRLYFEGDGSFFWTDPDKGWKLWGMLYDRMLRDDSGSHSHLQYAEVQGEFPLQVWQSVLKCLRVEDQSRVEPIEILLLPEMTKCSEAEFAQAWI